MGVMLPGLIRALSEHWQEIAAESIRRIRRDNSLPEMSRYPEANLRERARAILQHFDAFLTSSESEIAEHYERLGRTRFEEGVRLHELVRSLQILKRSMLEYAGRQGITGPLDVYAEEELELAVDRMFDRMIYSVVRGYELAFTEAPSRFGSMKPKRRKEPEFRGPTPF